MKRNGVQGMGLAVIEDGKILHGAAYGGETRNSGNQEVGRQRPNVPVAREETPPCIMQQNEREAERVAAWEGR